MAQKRERNTNVEITFLRTYPKTSYRWRCSISACWIPQYRLHTSYGCKPYLKGSPVPWQKVPGTFEKNRPYTRGRKIQTAYNASSHYHSIVQENCLSPVLSDSGTALETHPNSFLLLSLFRLEVGMQEKTHFHNRVHQQSFGREIMNDGPLGFMHGKRHITKWSLFHTFRDE